MAEPPVVPAPDPDGSRLTLAYDGENYQGRMSARELAGVLESLTDLAQGLSAASALGGSRPRVEIEAFAQGSFDIPAIIEAIGPNGYIVGGAALAGTAFRFYWKNMRRVVVNAVHDPDSGMWQVTLRSDEVLQWTEEEWRIYNSKRIRKAVRGIAAPLHHGATLTLSTSTDRVTVPPGDAYLFDADEDDEPADEVRRFETWVSPDTVSFDPTKKWRLWSKTTGGFSATIEDKQFTTDVQRGRVRVGRNDSFKVAVRNVTTPVEHEKPKVAWFIERVIEQQAGAEQDALPDDDGNEEA